MVSDQEAGKWKMEMHELSCINFQKSTRSFRALMRKQEATVRRNNFLMRHEEQTMRGTGLKTEPGGAIRNYYSSTTIHYKLK